MPFFKTKEEDEAGEDQESMLDSKESKKKGFKSKLHPNKLKKSIKNIDASKHVDKLKGSMKWISWVTKKVRQRGAAFPLFMIGINTLYLVLGGLIFMAIEKTPKVEYNTSKELVNIFDILKNSSVGYKTLPIFSSGKDVIKNFTASDINEFDKILSQITDERNAASKPQWSILNSIFFCLTVTTTIGYGTLAPVTFAGRMVCVVYALLGIPLTLALLAVVGKVVGDYINHICSLFMKWLKKVYPHYEYESKNSGGDDGEVDAPLWLALFILFAFTAITGALHCWMEGWDFGTAFYFQYVTYLTIGFGDVVPIDERFVFVNIFLTFFGLAVLSVTLSLIASNISHQMQKASFIEKLKDQEMSDVSVASDDLGSGDEQGSEKPSGMAGNEANGGKTYGSTSP